MQRKNYAGSNQATMYATASSIMTERRRAQLAAASLKYSYGMTLEQYEERKVRQRGLCPICFQPLEDSDKGRPCVDHVRGTKVVRGIVHDRCNLVIGHAHEDPQILRNAAEYLEKYQ